jgi:metallopeptidase MepB
MARTLLRKPPQDPPSFFKTPGALLSRANQLYEAFEQGMRDIGAMAGTQEPTFQNLLLPIAHLENEWEFEKDCLEFLTLYSPDESLRSAAKEISVIVEKGHTVQDTLWEFIKAVCDKKEELDTESQRFKETEMEGYMAKACHLPTISSNRMKEIDKMLYQINTDFKANLANESGGIWFSEAELAGVSEEDIQELSRGTGENEGKLRVRFKSNYSTILARAKDPDVRKRLWSGMQNSVSEHQCLSSSNLFSSLTSKLNC